MMLNELGVQAQEYVSGVRTHNSFNIILFVYVYTYIYIWIVVVFGALVWGHSPESYVMAHSAWRASPSLFCRASLICSSPRRSRTSAGGVRK